MSDNEEIIVELEDGQHRFTKSFLCTHSAYFGALCAYDFKENICNCVKLEGITVSSLNAITGFCRTQVLDFNMHDVYSVLETSIRLQFDEVTQHCITHLNNILDGNTCLKILQFSHKYSLEKLLRTSLRLSLWLFEYLHKTDDFKMLKLDCLVMYLGNKNLNVENELNVFIAMDNWVTFRAERLGVVDKLLKCLKFLELSPQNLRFMKKFPYIIENEDILGLINQIESIKEGLSDEVEKQTDILSALNKFWSYDSEINIFTRKFPIQPTFVGVNFQSLCNSHKQNFGMARNGVAKPTMIHYSHEGNFFQSGLSIPFTFEDPNSPEACGYSLAVIGRYLYLFGGEHNLGHNQWNLDVQRYDGIRDIWEYETRLPSPRRHQSVCVVEDDIYLVGGFGRYRIILDCVEKYDTVNREWHTCAKLPTPGFSLPCCNYRNKLLIFTTKFYTYCPKSDSWSDVELDLPQVSYDKPIVYKDEIYLLETCHPNLWKINLESNTVEKICELSSICRFATLYGHTIYLFMEGDGSGNLESDIVITTVNLRDSIMIQTSTKECESFKLSKNCSSCINYLNFGDIDTHPF